MRLRIATPIEDWSINETTEAELFQLVIVLHRRVHRTLIPTQAINHISNKLTSPKTYSNHVGGTNTTRIVHAFAQCSMQKVSLFHHTSKLSCLLLPTFCISGCLTAKNTSHVLKIVSISSQDNNVLQPVEHVGWPQECIIYHLACAM